MMENLHCGKHLFLAIHQLWNILYQMEPILISKIASLIKKQLFLNLIIILRVWSIVLFSGRHWIKADILQSNLCLLTSHSSSRSQNKMESRFCLNIISSSVLPSHDLTLVENNCLCCICDRRIPHGSLTSSIILIFFFKGRRRRTGLRIYFIFW